MSTDPFRFSEQRYRRQRGKEQPDRRTISFSDDRALSALTLAGLNFPAFSLPTVFFGRTASFRYLRPI
jgi:hypothetical protein